MGWLLLQNKFTFASLAINICAKVVAKIKPEFFLVVPGTRDKKVGIIIWLWLTLFHYGFGLFILFFYIIWRHIRELCT